MGHAPLRAIARLGLAGAAAVGMYHRCGGSRTAAREMGEYLQKELRVQAARHAGGVDPTFEHG